MTEQTKGVESEKIKMKMEEEEEEKEEEEEEEKKEELGEREREKKKEEEKKEDLSNSSSGYIVYCQSWNTSERKRDTIKTTQGQHLKQDYFGQTVIVHSPQKQGKVLLAAFDPEVILFATSNHRWL